MPTVTNLLGLWHREGGSQGETDWCFIQSDELSKRSAEWTECLADDALSKWNDEHTER